MKEHLEGALTLNEEILMNVGSSLNMLTKGSQEKEREAKIYEMVLAKQVEVIKAYAELEDLERKRDIEERRLRMEEATANANLDNQIKTLEAQVRTDKFKLIADIGIFAVQLLNYDMCYATGLRYEETGALSSKFFAPLCRLDSIMKMNRK